jgi:hypothetical protein
MEQEVDFVSDEQRMLPDLGITKKDAQVLLDQYMSQQISEDDFWWSLGFNFDGRQIDMDNAVYLVNLLKKDNAAHIWDGSDTACRMFSTGGLGKLVGRKGKKKFDTTTDLGGRSICLNCLRNINQE